MAELNFCIQSANAGKLVRKALQTSHCMDYDTFCKVMYGGKEDGYTREKWQKMNKDFKRWFCELDDFYAGKFMDYVMTKNQGGNHGN